MSFESVRNNREAQVFARVLEKAPSYPNLTQNTGVLEDAACLALNMLKPRYIRHHVDLMFHLLDAERAEEGAIIDSAVDDAFKILDSGRRKEPR